MLLSIANLLKCQTCRKIVDSPNCCRVCGTLTCSAHSIGRCAACGTETVKIDCKGFQDLARKCTTAQSHVENYSKQDESTTDTGSDNQKTANIVQICKELLNMGRYCCSFLGSGYMFVYFPSKSDVLHKIERRLTVEGMIANVNWACNMLCIFCDERLFTPASEKVDPKEYGIPVIYKPVPVVVGLR